MVELNEKALEQDRARLIHILVVHFDMFRDKAEAAADLFLHHKTLSALPAPDDGLVERLRAHADTPIEDDLKYIQIADDLMQEAATALQSKDEQIERLTRERDEVSSSLEYLLVGYVGRYCDPVPEWQPLPTLGGIISQLDNAMTVTATFKDRAEAAEQQVQKLTAENERLEANIARLTSHPADHRYWEGRYRDERAENERLREALAYAAKGLDHVHNGLMDPSRPRQSVGEVCLHFLTAARSALEKQDGGK